MTPKDDPSFSAFRYLVADKAPLYRRIVRVFVEAKQRYELHLRPRELREALESAADDHTALPEDVEGELIQLCEWGNLERHADTGDVRTVEQFNRARFLYGITPTGLAAEDAVQVFKRNLGRKGKLDTAALRDIRDHLKELETLVAAEEVDEVKSRQAMRGLTSSFDDLTSEAQRFLGGLQRTIELQTLQLRQFIAYKTQLIDYLQNFIHELVTATADIAATIHRIETRGVDSVLQATARSPGDVGKNAAYWMRSCGRSTEVTETCRGSALSSSGGKTTSCRRLVLSPRPSSTSRRLRTTSTWESCPPVSAQRPADTARGQRRNSKMP